MNTKNVNHIIWLATGLTACLATSSCTTFRDTQTTERGLSCPHCASLPLADKDARTPLSKSEMVRQKLQSIIIPEMKFSPPDTIIDALDFLKQASRDYEDSKIPIEKRGIGLILKLHSPAKVVESDDDPFAAGESNSTDVPVLPAMTARNISLYDALRLVCEVTGMKLNLQNPFVMIVPLEDPDSELISRDYTVLPLFSDRLYPPPEGSFEEFCAKMGVQWPTGSSVTYLEEFSKLRITNTHDNLAKFEQLLWDMNVLPTLVNVDMQIVAFQAKDIEKLQLAKNMTKEALLALQKAGKAKQVATTSAVVEPDQEAIVKVVQEIIFPSEFNVQIENASAFGGGVRMSKAVWVCEPMNFTMRETGMILQIIPKVMEGGLLCLNLRPQWVTLDRWETYGDGSTKKDPFRQPVFGVTSFETQVTLQDGDTILIGSSSTPDGKWVNVGFLTAKKLKVEQK